MEGRFQGSMLTNINSPFKRDITKRTYHRQNLLVPTSVPKIIYELCPKSAGTKRLQHSVRFHFDSLVEVGACLLQS